MKTRAAMSENEFVGKSRGKGETAEYIGVSPTTLRQILKDLGFQSKRKLLIPSQLKKIISEWGD
jgi:hypothetical protein